MNFLDRQFGRMGNRMFQMAALYAFSKEFGTDIYFQDPMYFDKYKDDILKMFGEGIGYDERVAMHVRRGDYVTTYKDFYVDLTKTDYYEKAINEFPIDKFLVFSDDIEWCKKQALFQTRCDFSEGKTEEEDLKLMASCKSQIIANSSFSYWAAYLNPNPNKKVIAPSVEHWHPDGVERTRCPKEWIRL